MTPSPRPRRLFGIGAGPANLSLAALAEGLADVAVTLWDRQPELRWHPGLGFPGAELQVSFLKDLVTLVDPTSRHSFLAFLKDRDRLYRALIANRQATSRAEFEAYLAWVAERLPAVRFGQPVEAVRVDASGFHVEGPHGTATADDLVIGVGRQPAWPDLPGIDAVAVHAAGFLPRPDDQLAGRTVAVVGGGQSGAEVVEYLLGLARPPAMIHWITRRLNLLPLDDSPFVNEQFFPPYVDYFRKLDPARRRWLLDAFKLTSDGISEATLDRIYRRLYDIECVEGRPRPAEIRTGASLVAAETRQGKTRLTVRDEVTGAVDRTIACDLLVCATGYRFALPDCLADIAPRLALDDAGEPVLDDGYAVAWDGPAGRRIYLQNGGRGAFGLADPNLSLLAWRSARILNHATGREAHRLGEESAALRWADGAAAPPLQRSA